jgi:hypothetical protein
MRSSLLWPTYLLVLPYSLPFIFTSLFDLSLVVWSNLLVEEITFLSSKLEKRNHFGNRLCKNNFYANLVRNNEIHLPWMNSLLQSWKNFPFLWSRQHTRLSFLFLMVFLFVVVVYRSAWTESLSGWGLTQSLSPWLDIIGIHSLLV